MILLKQNQCFRIPSPFLTNDYGFRKRSLYFEMTYKVLMDNIIQHLQSQLGNPDLVKKITDFLLQWI